MLFKRKKVIYIDVWVVIMERIKINVSEDPPYKNCCTDCKYDKNLLCTQIKFFANYRLVDLCGDFDDSKVTLDDEAYERFLNAKSDKERREIIDEFDPEVLVDDYDIDDYSEPDFKNYSVCGVPTN